MIEISKGFKVTTIAGTGSPGYLWKGYSTNHKGQLNRPTGMALRVIFGYGELYITDTGNNSIRHINLSSDFSDLSSFYVGTMAGPSDRLAGNTDGEWDKARFSSPTGVATTNTGVYVADTGNNSIRFFRYLTQDSEISVSTVLSNIPSPIGIVVDELGYMFISSGNMIKVRNPSNALFDFMGTTTAGLRHSVSQRIGGRLVPQMPLFDSPQYLALSPILDVLYIADTNNNMVRDVSLTCVDDASRDPGTFLGTGEDPATQTYAPGGESF